MAQRFISAQEQRFKRVLQYAPGMLHNMAVHYFLAMFLLLLNFAYPDSLDSANGS